MQNNAVGGPGVPRHCDDSTNGERLFRPHGPASHPHRRLHRALLRAKSFTLDGEAVVTGADCVAVFDALHRRHKAADAMYVFDLLEPRTARRWCGAAKGRW
jgi:hypothetical protein